MTEHASTPKNPATGPVATTDHAAFAHVARSYYPGIVALFTTVLIISNICATKGVAFFGDFVRMHRDLLADATEEIIFEKFGKRSDAIVSH